MDKGKDICAELKSVRRRIAEENGIPLEIPECTYKGPCRGTCPRCEAEVRYLENALADRLRLGKAATVAGIALALSGTAAQAQDIAPNQQQGADSVKTEQMMSMYEVKGTVVDQKTKEPLPFVNVVVMRDGKQAYAATTDFDGLFSLRMLDGEYDFEISYLGYMQYIETGVKVPMERPLAVELKPDHDAVIEGIIPVEVGGVSPLIDVGVPGPTQVIERDGVRVRAQY